MVSVLAIKILLLFFPGIFAVKIMELLIEGKKKYSNTEWVVNSFLLGLISYFITSFLPKSSGDFIEIFSNVETIRMSTWNIASATLIALCLAFILSTIINKDIFHDICRKLKVTNETSSNNVLGSIYYSSKADRKILQDSWVLVRRYDSDTVFQGNLSDYQFTNGRIELLLKDVSVFYNNKSTPSYKVKAIYFSALPEQIYLEYQ